MLEPTERARERESLLESVFKVYASLWDEALGVSHPFPVKTGLIRTLWARHGKGEQKGAIACRWTRPGG